MILFDRRSLPSEALSPADEEAQESGAYFTNRTLTGQDAYRHKRRVAPRRERPTYFTNFMLTDIRAESLVADLEAGRRSRTIWIDFQPVVSLV